MTITLGYRRVDRKIAEHEVINRIFFSWDRSMRGSLSLQDIVTGLGGIMGAGLMDAMEWFFALHVRPLRFFRARWVSHLTPSARSS